MSSYQARSYRFFRYQFLSTERSFPIPQVVTEFLEGGNERQNRPLTVQKSWNGTMPLVDVEHRFSKYLNN